MFKLSAHAKEEILKRSLDMDVVWRTLQQPGQILDAGNGNHCLQSKFIDPFGKTYLMRIFVNPTKEPQTVITLYKTSKIDKYWKPKHENHLR